MRETGSVERYGGWACENRTPGRVGDSALPALRLTVRKRGSLLVSPGHLREIVHHRLKPAAVPSMREEEITAVLVWNRFAFEQGMHFLRLGLPILSGREHETLPTESATFFNSKVGGEEFLKPFPCPENLADAHRSPVVTTAVEQEWHVPGGGIAENVRVTEQEGEGSPSSFAEAKEPTSGSLAAGGIKAVDFRDHDLKEVALLLARGIGCMIAESR